VSRFRRVGCALLELGLVACRNGETPSAANPQCDEGNAGITLPPGFCAAVFADEIGVARHLVVTPNGDVYISLEDARRSSANLAVGPGGEAHDLSQRPVDDGVLRADGALGVEGSDRGDGDARQQDE
jgi:hypothetical protein